MPINGCERNCKEPNCCNGPTAVPATWTTSPRACGAVRQDILDRDSLEGARMVVGEPQAAVTQIQGIAAGSHPLAFETIRCDIDQRERHLGHGGPDFAVAESDVAAVSRRCQ